MAEINQAIGAKGVVSNECKMVVHQYGDQIVEMLLAQVIRDNTLKDTEAYVILVLLWENFQLRPYGLGERRKRY